MDVDVKDRDEQYTPKFIFDALNVEFDLDVCAPIGGVSHIPAKRHYSIVDDSLNQQWNGFVWMNPPYSEGKPWHDKFMAHGNGICLVPMSKAYWFQTLWNCADATMLMPTPHLKFIQQDGSEKGIFIPLVLAAVGSKGCTALANSGLGKIR